MDNQADRLSEICCRGLRPPPRPGSGILLSGLAQGYGHAPYIAPDGRAGSRCTRCSGLPLGRIPPDLRHPPSSRPLHMDLTSRPNPCGLVYCRERAAPPGGGGPLQGGRMAGRCPPRSGDRRALAAGERAPPAIRQAQYTDQDDPGIRPAATHIPAATLGNWLRRAQSSADPHENARGGCIPRNSARRGTPGPGRSILRGHVNSLSAAPLVHPSLRRGVVSCHRAPPAPKQGQRFEPPLTATLIRRYSWGKSPRLMD